MPPTDLSRKLKWVGGAVYLLLLTSHVDAQRDLSLESEEKISVHHWNLNPLTYERGYTMGFLNRSTIEGVPPIRSLEGSIQLGFHSSDAAIVDVDCVRRERQARGLEVPPDLSAAVSGTRNPSRASRDRNPVGENLAPEVIRNCQVEVNPWRFSTTELQQQAVLRTNTGRPVLIYYHGARIVIIPDTHRIIKEIWPVNHSRPLSALSMERKWSYPIGRFIHYGFGIVEGRFVRANVVKNIRQNYEVLVQLGPAGDNFVTMNLASSDLYEFIVEVMATGRYLRISYYELFNFQQWPSRLIQGYRTPYRIYRVDVIEGPH